MDPPVDPTACKEATKVSESAITKYVEAMKLYNENSNIIHAWDLADDKSLSIVQLKMADKLQYLRKSTAAGTWDNIKEQFDKQGPALIFVDFRAAVNFHFKENQELAIQVAGLNTIISHLATKGFILDPKIQAMLILTGLPASWDGIQSTILANHVIDTLTAESVILILQEEWKRQQARRSDKLQYFTLPHASRLDPGWIQGVHGVHAWNAGKMSEKGNLTWRLSLESRDSMWNPGSVQVTPKNCDLPGLSLDSRE